MIARLLNRSAPSVASLHQRQLRQSRVHALTHRFPDRLAQPGVLRGVARGLRPERLVDLAMGAAKRLQ